MSLRESPLSLLKNISMFDTLLPEYVEALARFMHVQSRAAREYVFYRSDPGDGLYIIIKGRIEIAVWMSTKTVHKDAAVQLLYADDFFGEYGMITGAPRGAAAIAATKTKLLLLPTSEYQYMRRTNAELTLALHDVLFRGMAARQQRTNKLTALLRVFPLRLRVIKFLTLMCRQDDSGPYYILDHLTEEDMAAFLNVKRPTLSPELHKLRKDGLIDIERRRRNKLIVPSMAQLFVELEVNGCMDEEEDLECTAMLKTRVVGDTQQHKPR